MRTRSSLLLVIAACLASSACRQDMQDQPRYKPLGENNFFADGRDSRPIPPNTIAVDELNNNDAFHTGAANGKFLDTIPLQIDLPLLERGRERFNIYCSPCHGRAGDGNGMVALRGFRAPPSFHSDRLRSVPPGYIFEVISNGYGAMPDYDDQIVDVRDRWAIVAYVRALQLSQDAALSDVPAQYRHLLSQPGARQ